MTFFSPTNAMNATGLCSLLSKAANQQFCLPALFKIRCMFQPQGQAINSIMAGGCVRPDPQLDLPGCPPQCPPEPACPEEQEWTVCQQENGRATIDLGDQYELELNENKSQVIVRNKENGEETNIWGDPHVDWNRDGKTDVDFWGKTTFQLEDGTKITIDTEKWKGNEDMYVANELTITKGDKVIQVTGLSQNEIGDMQINQSDRGGQLMDLLVTDGFVVNENACGEGWINPQTGEMATQEDFNVTRPGAEKPYEFCQDFGRALGLFLVTGLMDWRWNG
ncbi:MAG: DUF1521 domain-containing protein [Candidatus Thiodiazotropha lotti]|nr:DUF1521 domain-containing protein [Candidatus Thiodiazotropha lotti]MCG7990953.1 DUF1521 domain-containing protein [Candidatus Thiodiazotropha lotti]MCG8001177.1 DUF1521 domain-containing protein [Candidatus Thiodiazotropha lotti]MCW4182607.1 DUF1521 domain-containing protein [Candidatus Thiodiazotropha weberae]MCW4192951.1 DUF1521 domain-containing protein [Candidatus Thiodiazotropha weberae]